MLDNYFRINQWFYKVIYLCSFCWQSCWNWEEYMFLKYTFNVSDHSFHPLWNMEFYSKFRVFHIKENLKFAPKSGSSRLLHCFCFLNGSKKLSGSWYITKWRLYVLVIVFGELYCLLLFSSAEHSPDLAPPAWAIVFSFQIPSSLRQVILLLKCLLSCIY